MKKVLFYTAIFAIIALCLQPVAQLRSSESCPEETADASATEHDTLDSNTSGTGTTTVTDAYEPEEPASASSTTYATAYTETTAAVQQGALSDYYFRGSIFGANGNLLLFTEGQQRHANTDYDVAFANLLSDASAVKLDTVLGPSDYRTSKTPALLRQANPTAFYPDGYHPIGQSVMLTVDEQLQRAAYEYLELHGIKGCIVKMRGDGAIRIAASYPSFSHNAQVSGTSNALANPRDAFNNQCFTAMQPGSVFKILSATVAVKNNMTSFDDPGIIGNWKVENWDYATGSGQYPVRRDIASAISDSSNCVFATVAYDLGANRFLSELDTLSCFSSSMSIDGVTVTQTADMRTNANLARCGYGQKVSVSPVYMTAAALGAASTGEMVQPYLVDKTYDTLLCTPLQSIGKKQVRSTIPEAYTQQLRQGMLAVSENLGLHKDGCSVLSKTGTAAVNHSGYTDFMSIISVITNDETGESEAVMLVVQNPADFGYRYASNFKNNMQDLIDLLM
ncbi:MAG: penicillin-binding transpeptidase domain-containing protein [Oscillospiraceae bacterium]|nr:penicillin-binding transpeptidase domain-containing protein [Oscillospiraceae bacterium]